jgi:S1-C subfamily serine protease
MGLKRPQLDELRKIVEQSAVLAPAQRAALHDIVFHVFLSGEEYDRLPVGFMGVTLDNVHQAPVTPPDDAADESAQWRGRSGVLITQRLPGFCGFRYLQENDLVVAVMGNDVVRVSEMQELMAIVRATPPGEMLTLQLIRQGKPMRVSLRVEPRPAAATGQNQVEEFLNPRLSKAQEYWDKTFAPLLAAKLS